MEWLRDKEQIEQREDGSFVVLALIDGNWVSYHVTPDYSPELYTEVQAFLAEE